MNPLLATGLLSLGHKLLDRMSAPTSQAQAPSSRKVDFATLMNQTEQAKDTLLSMMLANKGIETANDLKAYRSHLVGQMMNDPGISSLLTNQRDTQPLTLHIEGANQITVQNSAGQKINLSSDSPIGEMAREIHYLSSLKELSDRFSEMPIISLASSPFTAQIPQQATWLLNV